jgi:nucleosome assembly protein 1-like 1
LITDRDEKALEYLRNVRFEHLDPNTGDNKMGFKLFFEFDENPFFEGKVLEKTYHYLVSTSRFIETVADGYTGGTRI